MACQVVNDKNCCSITWSVENFSYSWQKKKEAIFSPVFSIYMPEETKWQLLLCPRGSSDENCIAFFLHRKQDCNGAEIIEVEFRMECLRADGSILTRGETKNVFSKNDQWGYSKFRTREDVFINKNTTYLPQNILTVRCKMNLSRMETGEKQLADNRNIFARTIINIEKKSLLWTVQEFSSLKPGEKKCLEIKSASKKRLIKFDLFLTDCQNSEEKINLNICSSDRSIKFFTLKTLILDSENRKITAGEFESLFEPGKSSTFTLNISKNKLIRSKGLYLPNDILSLSLDFTTSTGFAFEGVEKIDFGTISHATTNEVLENWQKCDKMINEKSSALITDLASLYKDKTFCDVQLRTKTNVFPSHISILGARSPVFRAMFSTDMKEKLNGDVDVSDLDDKTVQQLLMYLYTDRLEELEWEDTIELYKVADKYTMISLKKRCSLILKDKLDLKNACRTLILSDLLQDEDLKTVTKDFILSNMKEILNSDGWKFLADTNSKLALETTLQNWNY